MKRLRFILAALLTLALTVSIFTALGGQKAQAAEKAANGRDVSVTLENGLQVLYWNEENDSWADIVGYVGTSPEVVIPAYIGKHRVYRISHNAFEGNKTITSVEIPYALKDIENYAFKDCTSLKEVKFGDYYKFIEEQEGSVKKTSMPSYIWYGAFEGCTSLEEITFPYGIQTYS
nr:leucine-rich repeat domain-containing protein [Lachnospiraceae bacterium]